MGNMIDYLKWRGDLTFKASAINRIDMLIMSQLSLIDLEGIVPDINSDEEVTIEEASINYFDPKYGKSMEIGLIIPQTILRLFKLLGTTKRFKNITMSKYINIIDDNVEEQISAVVFKIDNKTKCISFSGTDDTIIGWKENLNMIYKFPIPAQRTAVKYVEEIAKDFDGEILICGHSKGGNMSLYSSVFVSDEVQSKITKVYNFDGPGFSEASQAPNDIIKKLGKVTTIIPQSSVVGVLFQHKEKCVVVKSNETGLYQHDAFSWEIEGKKFIEEETLTKESENIDKKIREIISELSEEEKVKFCDNLYTLLSAGDTKRLIDINKKRKYMWDAFWKLSKDDRKYIVDPIRKLIRNRYIRNIIFTGLRDYKNYKNKEV